MVIPEAKSKTAGANINVKNEPWVLASQVDQCFLITDPTRPSRVVVRRGKRSITGMNEVDNHQDFDQYGDPKIEDDDDDGTKYTTRRSRTTLPTGRSGCSRAKLLNRDKEGQENCETLDIEMTKCRVYACAHSTN